MTEYVDAVRQLLALGEPDTFEPAEWPDYGAMGLGPERIPDLIRLATDPAVRQADSKSTESWAPVHAWRALGQLRAEMAAEPLLSLLDWEDEWGLEELPKVYRMIGPAAVPALAAFLADSAQDVGGRVVAAYSLAEIAQAFPAVRADCVAPIVRTLADADSASDLNADLVVALLDLEAREALPTIEQAFEAGRVAQFMVPWRHVQVKLNLPGYRDDLLPAPKADPVTAPDRESTAVRSAEREQARAAGKAKAKTKARRKQAAKSRQKNRKRK